MGEGLFFAGQNHVIIRIVASQTEAQLITTNPLEPLAERAATAEAETLGDTESPTPEAA